MGGMGRVHGTCSMRGMVRVHGRDGVGKGEVILWFCFGQTNFLFLFLFSCAIMTVVRVLGRDGEGAWYM